MKETISNRLRAARALKGWTLQEAENHTGIKIVTLGSYERGYRLPPIDVLHRLAVHYETSIAWLVGEVQ